MNKKALRISVRNFLITILVIVFVVSSAESTLSFKNRQSDEYLSYSEENQNIMLLQVEHMPAERFFSSATNIHNVKNIYGADFTPTEKTYPLIEHLTKETESDNAFNIVVIGDSFVWGAYSLNRNELFWRLLENDLRNDGFNVNVYGVGTTGANAYEELSWLMNSSLIQNLNPDLVIFGYVYNDSDDSVEINGESVNWDKELPVLSKLKGILPNLYSALIERIAVKTMYNDKYSDNVYLPYDGAPPALKGRFYEKYKKDFVQKLDSFAEATDLPVAVVALPTLPENIMLEELYKPLEELYSSCKNIRYYNCIKEYNDFASFKHRNNYSVNIADFHPGSAANRFYADYIKTFIMKDFSDLLDNHKEKYTPSDSITINDWLPYGVLPVKESENSEGTTYKLEYPDPEITKEVYGVEIPEYFLTLPLGKKHIRLSFSDTVDIASVRIRGEYKNLELHYTCKNKKLNYDDHTVYTATKSQEDVFSVRNAEEITSILISAEFEKDADRSISITFQKREVSK